MSEILAGVRLVRALERSAELAGCSFDFVARDSRSLSCGLFCCAEHRLQGIVAGQSAQAWLDTLDEYAIFLPGYVLVQLAVGAIEEKGEQLLVEIQAQTVKEA
ncbi:hypothetical protein IWY39_000581 [Sphingobium sp. JAI105]|uniref:hypothetical protein n=1 Tax=Sphingobium sp. JAI105 TaxID=2787715 RepID=UPI0018C92EE2|nr:hypothetical protein [Sphingobium sp. JAI105]MBG6116777.1 hypothetical protein [Sphingobium sp. JAI105]